MEMELSEEGGERELKMEGCVREEEEGSNGVSHSHIRIGDIGAQVGCLVIHEIGQVLLVHMLRERYSPLQRELIDQILERRGEQCRREGQEGGRSEVIDESTEVQFEECLGDVSADGAEPVAHKSARNDNDGEGNQLHKLDRSGGGGGVQSKHE